MMLRNSSSEGDESGRKRIAGLPVSRCHHIGTIVTQFAPVACFMLPNAVRADGES
jgi:hypothetical protein